MKETLPKETASQKQRIAAGELALVRAMFDFEPENNAPTETEWLFILTKLLYKKPVRYKASCMECGSDKMVHTGKLAAGHVLLNGENYGTYYALCDYHFEIARKIDPGNTRRVQFSADAIIGGWEQ